MRRLCECPHSIIPYGSTYLQTLHEVGIGTLDSPTTAPQHSSATIDLVAYHAKHVFLGRVQLTSTTHTLPEALLSIVGSALHTLELLWHPTVMPSLEEGPHFTGKAEVLTFAGILFDMDGTIVDSTDAIVKHW